MVMQIKPAGTRSPKLNRILISGGGGSGKTTLAAKFASVPERALFISTDGNANRQGYRAIDFEFPTNAEQIITNFIQALNIAEQDSANWDVLVIDLIEDFDERDQTLLRKEIGSRQAMRAWGKINALYKDMQSLLMSKFRDKTIVLLSRDVEEIDQKSGEITGYKPALRKALKNLVLKDQDVEIRAYFDKDNRRRFDISNLRYDEMRPTLQQIINKPVELPHSQASNKNEEDTNKKIQDQYERAINAATSKGATDKDIEYWENMDRAEAVLSIVDWLKIQESAKQHTDIQDGAVEELFPLEKG